MLPAVSPEFCTQVDYAEAIIELGFVSSPWES